MKRALGVNGGSISNQKIADEIVSMARETPDWLASDPCPGRGIIGAILRGSRSAQSRSAYILSCWLRWRQQQLADDPSQDQSQDQGDDQDLEDQGDYQDLEDIRLLHSQCMSQEVFEEAVDDLLRDQWAMAWNILPEDYWRRDKEQKKLVYAERGRASLSATAALSPQPAARPASRRRRPATEPAGIQAPRTCVGEIPRSPCGTH